MPKKPASPLQVSKTISRTVRTEYTLTLSTEQVIQLLNGDRSSLIWEPEEGFHAAPLRVPHDAQLTVVVPSGGDYSGDSLGLNEAGGLVVYWQEVETEHS